jgi:hypothetical protein
MAKMHKATAGSKQIVLIAPFKELRQGDCAALKRYIKEGGNVNAREAGSPHITLLHAAGVMKLSTAARFACRGRC